jgi:hypothetical protein
VHNTPDAEESTMANLLPSLTHGRAVLRAFTPDDPHVVLEAASYPYIRLFSGLLVPGQATFAAFGSEKAACAGTGERSDVHHRHVFLAEPALGAHHCGV